LTWPSGWLRTARGCHSGRRPRSWPLSCASGWRRPGRGSPAPRSNKGQPRVGQRGPTSPAIYAGQRGWDTGQHPPYIPPFLRNHGALATWLQHPLLRGPLQTRPPREAATRRMERDRDSTNHFGECPSRFVLGFLVAPCEPNGRCVGGVAQTPRQLNGLALVSSTNPSTT
jgi:hypothetical protein